MTTSAEDNLLVDLITGAVAGVVGVWALDRVDWTLYDRESEAAHQQLIRARPHGRDPAHNLAALGARLFGRELKRQPNAAGISIHYGLGVGAAMAYAALRRRFPTFGLGAGTVFGALVWLLQDEGLNTVTGLAGKPQEYPATTHLRGLAAHMAFGLATELVLRLRPGRSAL
jgi:uncharacterized membrane protein YagU involved in acid resistance